jgi:hypothetical protein
MGWVCVSTKEELFPGMSHINCPLLNFTRHVFCLFVITGLFQKSFDNVLSMSLLSSHLCNWYVYDCVNHLYFLFHSGWACD